MEKIDKKRAIIYASVLFGVLIVFAISVRTLSSKVGEFIRNASNSPIISFSTAGCGSPSVSYGVGEVDQTFGVSSEIFKDALGEAESIWEKGSGDDLFSYSGDPEVVVNLVFDERQAETNYLKEILGSIESNKDKLEALKKEYEKLTAEIIPIEVEFSEAKKEYEALVNELNSTIALYNVRKEAYEESVAYWNKRGGAPKKDYERLVKEYDDVRILYGQVSMRDDLAKASFDDLRIKADAYNIEAGKINTVAGIINRLAERLNESATDYNKLQGDRDEFVTGLYTSVGGKETIDIYQFYDYRELVIILAHEMGHALGLGHGSDQNSIMYPKVGDQPLSLSSEDVSMLKEVCSKK